MPGFLRSGIEAGWNAADMTGIVQLRDSRAALLMRFEERCIGSACRQLVDTGISRSRWASAIERGRETMNHRFNVYVVSAAQENHAQEQEGRDEK
jgi:hypothetical protein